MNFNELILDNNLTDYGMLIGCGIIFSFSLYYLIKGNYITTPSKNIEGITNEEIGTIISDNMVPISEANVDSFITDSDSETDVESDHDTIFNSDSDSDSASGFEDILNDPNISMLPFVDFDVCSIQELKFFEYTSLYSRQLAEHNISDAEVMEFISWWTNEQLATRFIDVVFLYAINLL
jgi:hypothetical protein